MIELKRVPFVGDERILNMVDTIRPRTKIKVEHTADVFTGNIVVIEGTEYKIRSVNPHGPVSKGNCFIRVSRTSKEKRLQAKDLCVYTILKFLAVAKKPVTWSMEVPKEDTVAYALTEIDSTNVKVLLRKMASLKRQGYVSGCACGCHGRFEITDQGHAALIELQNEI